MTVYVDPSYSVYYGDRLFDRDDPVLGRDGTLEPWWRLRSAAQERGLLMRTADQLLSAVESRLSVSGDYYSLGTLQNYDALRKRRDVNLKAFVVFEPPVVAPGLYRALPQLTAAFERVYVHNTEGDGYSLTGVDRSRLRKLYWPQPYSGALPRYWNCTSRAKRIVVINGNHMPRSFSRELYGTRIAAMAQLEKLGVVDLYGRGWKNWWSRRSMWLPYWLNRRALMNIYRGECSSKYEVLSRYQFSLCFENMAMKGYLTEKLFDCLYAGTIPLYLGAPDIADLVPADAYVDCRKFSSWQDLWRHVNGLSATEIEAKRSAGRVFLESSEARKYYDALLPIFDF